jgi:hypothetical protein
MGRSLLGALCNISLLEKNCVELKFFAQVKPGKCISEAHRVVFLKLLWLCSVEW